MRSGTDVTLIAFGKLVGYNLKAAELLEQEGISCEVLNLRSLKPIDRDAIAASIRKTHRVVSVEEGWPQHGVGAGAAGQGQGRRFWVVWCGVCGGVDWGRSACWHACVLGGACSFGCLPSPHFIPLPPCPSASPAEIMALAIEECFDDLDAPPERITGAEVPMPYAQNLEAAALPHVEHVVATVKRMLGKQ